MDFWGFFWLMIWSFFFICYLMVLFQVIIDVFRDDETSGWGKAGWIILLIFLPALGALIYLIARGEGMNRRQRQRYAPVPEESDVRIAHAPGQAAAPAPTPAADPGQQISQAKALLDSGAITAEEYDALKARALS